MKIINNITDNHPLLVVVHINAMKITIEYTKYFFSFNFIYKDIEIGKKITKYVDIKFLCPIVPKSLSNLDAIATSLLIPYIVAWL